MQDLLTEEVHQEVRTKRKYSLARTMILLAPAWAALVDDEQKIVEHFDEAEYYAYKEGLIDWDGRVTVKVITPSG